MQQQTNNTNNKSNNSEWQKERKKNKSEKKKVKEERSKNFLTNENIIPCKLQRFSFVFSLMRQVFAK
jgi:hypothetical protein